MLDHFRDLVVIAAVVDPPRRDEACRTVTLW